MRDDGPGGGSQRRSGSPMQKPGPSKKRQAARQAEGDNIDVATPHPPTPRANPDARGGAQQDSKKPGPITMPGISSMSNTSSAPQGNAFLTSATPFLSGGSQASRKMFTVVNWNFEGSCPLVFYAPEQCNSKDELIQLLADNAPLALRGKRIVDFDPAPSRFEPKVFFARHGCRHVVGQTAKFDLYIKVQDGNHFSEESCTMTVKFAED